MDERIEIIIVINSFIINFNWFCCLSKVMICYELIVFIMVIIELGLCSLLIWGAIFGVFWGFCGWFLVFVGTV
jgi:hypothetical protein